MAGVRHQVPERGAGERGSTSGERTAGVAAQRAAAYGDWRQLQRTVGNRMVGELLQRGVRISAAPKAVGVQRAPGLPTRQELRDEGLKAGTKPFGKTTWGKLEDALAAYEKLGDTNYQAQQEQMQKIESLIGEWRASYDQRASKEKLKKKDPAKLAKMEQILAGIRQRRAVIQEAETPSSVGREGRRRAEAFLGVEGLASVRKEEVKKEEKKEEKPTVTLMDYLIGRGYKTDRNYLSWSAGKIAHVSWKAHVGSGDAAQRLAIAQAVSPLLVSWGVSHKFELTTTEGPLDKFLTVYPPKEEKEWALLVDMVEAAVSSFTTVDVSGDMPVGEAGKVHMRHGQNTPLTPDMLKDVEGIEQRGHLGGFQQYMGDAVQGEGLPLLLGHGRFFFSKTMEAPAQLTPNHVYMAILVDDRIVPDKREEPNPANVPLPPGIKKFERQ